MKSWFKDYDILSPRIAFYFEGHHRYFSVIGIFMSFMCFIEIGILGFYFLVNFINGKDKVIVHSRDLKDRIISANLSDKIFFYKVVDFYGNVADPKAIQTLPILFSANTTNTKKTILNQVFCNLTQEKMNLINFEPSNFTCLYHENGVVLSNNKLSHNIDYISLSVTKCRNSSENIECYPPEKIEEILQKNQYYLHFYTEISSIDHDTKFPFYSSVHIEKIPLYNDMINIYNYEMRKIKYESDEGLILYSQQLYEDFGLDTSTKTIRVYPKGHESFLEETLLNVQVSINGGHVDNYKRAYQKVQNLAANIGGISFLIYFFSKIITTIFCKGVIILSIHNGVAESNIQISLTQFKRHLNDKLRQQSITKFQNLSPIKGKTYHHEKNHQNHQSMRNLKCYELFFYHCFKYTSNSSSLREFEKKIRSTLDIKNLILLWKEFKEKKFESTISPLGDRSTLYFLGKDNKILSASNNESGMNLDPFKRTIGA